MLSLRSQEIVQTTIHTSPLKSQVYTTQETEQFEISFQLQFVSYWKTNKQVYKLQWMHFTSFIVWLSLCS